ncbi:hypothetical protein NMG60_11031236 [Bertholletia excelsa]
MEFLDEDWESMCSMFSIDEADHHFMSFETSLASQLMEEEANGSMARFNENFLFDFLYSSQESSTDSVFVPDPSHGNNFYSHSSTTSLTNITSHEPMNLCLSEILCMEEGVTREINHPLVVSDPSKELQLKRKLDMPEQFMGGKSKTNPESISKNPTKETRVSNYAQKAASKRTQKCNPRGRDEQTSSFYSSEDEPNASHQELSGEVAFESKGLAASNSKSNGKTRSTKGAATDPQSVYARRRRERINERLRILQNLVPNGKKLLSSDDLWMYAPIAYNGMDSGLCPKISPTA